MTTVVAARRALHYRGALHLRPHSGAAASQIIDGSNGAETTTHIIPCCPILWNRYSCSSSMPLSIGRHRYSITCRKFSSESIETVSPSDDTISRVRGSQPDNPEGGRTPRRRRKSYQSTAVGVSTAGAETDSLPPLAQEEYDPREIADRIHQAAKFDQGRLHGQPRSNIRDRTHGERKWDYDSVRRAVDDYERHLRYVLSHLEFKKKERSSSGKVGPLDSADVFKDIDPCPDKSNDTHRLLRPPVLSKAVRALTRSRTDTPALSRRVRDIERLVGLIGWTPITEELSYRLLEANGKAGNVRRTLALLELRRRRGYPPREQDVNSIASRTIRDNEEDDGGDDIQTGDHNITRGEKEFVHAITSIQAAQLPLRRSRNIYLPESSLPESSLDNPTNYLDALLLNMSQRGVPLRPEIAARMLACYASAGRTGRALHYFYRVVRDPVQEDGYYTPGPHPTELGKHALEEWKAEEEEEDEAEADDTPSRSEKSTRARMVMHSLPPFHKVPSSVRGQNLGDPYSFDGPPEGLTRPPARQKKTRTKYEWELDREWSLSLTAAFAFADSLTHGACGHDPIELDVSGWNCLIKACCHRGAFHRALKILNETMPQKGIDPDSVSYNTILAGLARVGDVTSLKEYLTIMTNKGMSVNKYTAQAMADGFLNVGDISGASTIVQDVFNQHGALPPYTTHLKIVEFALANSLVFEAKRHVYFVQQLWKWRPSPHHTEEVCKVVEATKRNPKLSRRALQKLFLYFHEDLSEKEFF
eukprot:CAMPEP_0172547404 /NCGR_PEP_ID=MMETSP1067-20121228/16948_1 /TAXON_ID=265564 ORGANISM="Thalassiosira punctigera, Strain Tpunct2005C2" /NCGR_SAMPLE_ID=MMETSP1067 /ASSEMBLY_ACC=CAM_ASM_000444 /LENGTH=758 /DNA_ID=CAMNT_0013334489 /DNA_START=33 /DNA_END=2309 /DNA_ORIENTATION=+